ncbi:MAG: GNAT family N-acetyltransferase [bacterium]
MLHRAAAADLPAVEALLEAATLPTAGVADHVDTLWVWRDRGKVIGCIGFEAYGSVALLRSLVVDPAHRGAGLGKRLIGAGVAEMRRAHVSRGYGLTTTIAPLLARLGWKEVPRTALPPALGTSQELSGACPASAVAFRLDLAT